MSTMATLAQAQALLPGSRMLGGPASGGIAFERVHSDTRTLRAGDLFVALRGEHFDAHDFLPQAAAAGAVAAIAEHGLGDAGSPLCGLLVNDSLQALQQFAAAWRTGWNGPLIAVTGSNGKTTVTQMVASILHAWLGDAALATAGNLNNHIGVPLTLLRLRPQHRAAVLELGMNHPGEISLLAGLVRPTVALVNNAQREHLEFMASVDAVARENGSVIEALAADGIAVLPAGDAHLPLWRALAGARRVWTFGTFAAGENAAAGQADMQAGMQTVGQADVQADGHWQADGSGWVLHLYTPIGGADTTLALAGRHNVANAAAATACALAAGAPLAAVARGLAAFQPVAGRSQMLPLQLHGRQITLIDDSYNANPDSVLAAIDVLAGLPGPRWLVLGDMGEVGNQGPRFHAEVGEQARERGIETVWAVGALAAHVGGHRHFATTVDAVAALADAPAAASVLVKGSRFMRMEQVVRALQQGAATCC